MPTPLFVTALAGLVQGFPNGEGVPASWLVMGLPKGYVIRNDLNAYFAAGREGYCPANDLRNLAAVDVPGMRHCIHCGGLIPTFQTTCRHCGKDN